VLKGITAARSFGAELHHLDDLRRRRGEDHRIGRLALIQVSVLACCSRSALPVEKGCRSASALGEGRSTGPP
jgi:hypothetical protein